MDDSLISIISDLKFGRETLLKSIEGLSYRELTETEIYSDWTIKDVLAHCIGWDERVARNLPFLLQNRADEIPSVEPDDYNQQSVAAWRDKPFSEVLNRLIATHQEVIAILTPLDYKEIDTRRQRKGQYVTIRNYVIEVMMEHDRAHAAEIQLWRKAQQEAIDPATITQQLHTSRKAFMAMVDHLPEAELTRKGVVGRWSIKDVMGHIADWERILLQTAQHIYDPSLPAVTLLSQNIDELNMMMAAQRDMKPLSIELRYLNLMQIDWDEFIDQLKPADWRLRGPYPWENDQGSLAEVVVMVAEHYTDHNLERG